MPAIAFEENPVNASPQLLAPSITLNPPGGFSPVTASVVVSGLLLEDRISIRNQGVGIDQIGFSGVDVTYGGVAIGTASGGTGVDFVVTLNASSTLAAIEALVENLTYANVSDTPTFNRMLTLDVSDGTGRSAINPSFFQTAGSGNPLDGVDIGVSSAPAFGDLDDDGDLDMIAGAQDGSLRYFQNTGTAVLPMYAASVVIGSDVGDFSTPALGDLDGDGDLDIVVGEIDGVLNYFQNMGTASAPLFSSSPVAIGVDIGFYSVPTLGDLDGDGDLDMVVGEQTGILNYFQNTGTAIAPVFTSLPVSIASDVGDHSTPSLGDVDGDGDLDLIIGEQAGILNYFRNDGTGAAPVFGASVSIASKLGLFAAPTVADLDGDSQLDIIVGRFDGDFVTFIDQSTRRIATTVTAQNEAPLIEQIATSRTFAENTVNAQPQLIDADVTLSDPEGNFANGSIIVSGLLAEDRVTIRNQGTGAGQIGLSASIITYGGGAIGAASGGVGGNLVITLNANATAAGVEALIENLTYANVSNTPTTSRTLVLDVRDGDGASAISPVLPLVQLDSVNSPLDGIDVGSYAKPTFGDYDGDGDRDMLVGAGSDLHYFQNTGTASAPVFTTAPVLLLENLVVTGAAPALGDINGDGLLDLIIGDEDGELKYFRNQGTKVISPFDWPPATFGAFVYNPMPALGDLDGDGDLDIIAGDLSGVLRLYENTWTTTPFFFSSPPNLVGSDVGLVSKPALGDLDLDGDLDMVVGEAAGGLMYFKNIGSASTPVFAAPVLVLDGLGNEPSPALVDFNSDGYLDIVIGRADGTFTTFLNNIVPHIIINVTAEAEVAPTSGDDTLSGSLGNDTMDLLSGNDSYFGDQGDDIVLGNSGNDTLNGDEGNDTLLGGSGIDTLDGGAGNDSMAGGANNDFYFVDSTGDIVIEIAPDGFDTVRTVLNSYKLSANVERVDFIGSGNFVGIGNSGHNRFTGGLNDDRFVDILGGNDIMSGGAGSDSVDFRTSTTGAIINLATGTHGGAATGDTYASIEKFFGSSTAGDAMTAGVGRANFSGFGGNDTLTGGGNIDALQGNDGNDSLNGAGGIDNLDGGAGNDTLTGGIGNDYFVFSAAGFGQDLITDFADGLDKLKVHSSIANNISAFNITGNGSTNVVLTQISSPTNTITLQGATAITITAADFLFY